MWKDKFETELLMPELAMIRFAVFDEDVGSRDDFIGQFSLPFTSVRPGMLLYLSLLYCVKYWRSNGIKSYDIIKQQQRRRLRKRHLKSKLALLLTLSGLFHLIHSSNVGEFFWSWILKDSVEVQERQSRCLVFMSSKKTWN